MELAGKELKKLMTLDDKILQMAKDLQRDNEIYDGLVCERQHQLSSTDIGCCVDSWWLYDENKFVSLQKSTVEDVFLRQVTCVCCYKAKKGMEKWWEFC